MRVIATDLPDSMKLQIFSWNLKMLQWRAYNLEIEIISKHVHNRIADSDNDSVGAATVDADLQTFTPTFTRSSEVDPRSYKLSLAFARTFAWSWPCHICRFWRRSHVKLPAKSISIHTT